MKARVMTPNEIRSKGIAILVKSLGPVSMARFLQQFDAGTGDYTKDRARWLDKTDLDGIFKAIEEKRRTKKTQ